MSRRTRGQSTNPQGRRRKAQDALADEKHRHKTKIHARKSCRSIALRGREFRHDGAKGVSWSENSDAVKAPRASPPPKDSAVNQPADGGQHAGFRSGKAARENRRCKQQKEYDREKNCAVGSHEIRPCSILFPYFRGRRNYEAPCKEKGAKLPFLISRTLPRCGLLDAGGQGFYPISLLIP